MRHTSDRLRTLALTSAALIACATSRSAEPDAGDGGRNPSPVEDGGGRDGVVPLDAASHDAASVDGAAPDGGAAPDTAPDGGAAPDADAGTIELVPLDGRLYVSGSRLRARVLDGGGGALMFRSFYDTELDLDCALQLADDGEMRCLPIDPDRPHIGEDFHSSYRADLYADSECAEPAVTYVATYEESESNDECARELPEVVTTYTMGRSPTRCGLPGVVYRISPEELDDSFRQRDGQCESFGGGCTHAAERLDASTFVRARVVRARVDASLELESAHFEDGAALVLTARDVARDAPCAPDSPLVADRCVPPVSSVNAYLDAQCTGARATNAWSECTEPEIAKLQVGECSNASHQLFELGEAVAQAYFASPLGCMARSGHLMHAVGPELEPATLPKLEFELAGSDRLAVQLATSEDGVLLGYEPASHDSPTFFDKELDIACAVKAFVDGSVRCVPIEEPLFVDNFGDPIPIELVTRGPVFADAECTQPVTPARSAVDGCSFTPTRFARFTEGRGLVGYTHQYKAVYELGSEVVVAIGEPIYYDADCSAVGTAELDHYAVGPEVELVTVVDRVE